FSETSFSDISPSTYKSLTMIMLNKVVVAILIASCETQHCHEGNYPPMRRPPTDAPLPEKKAVFFPKPLEN
ncbi:MAG: hypothetical protein IKL85_06150, partial [Lentisphaeria bacterium]|nr:hypothetical protein [Lentisphaeria bacterium]